MSRRRPNPWELSGPDERSENPALRDALRMAHAPARPPTEDDVPPLSTFPITRAARAALNYARQWKE